VRHSTYFTLGMLCSTQLNTEFLALIEDITQYGLVNTHIYTV
jgi:hypothetical protein